MSKAYDRAYFDRWYRGDRAVGRGSALVRKVALAVAVAEYHLGRRLRSVLDVGCGEGAWRAPLLRLRPDIAYLGLDSSEYAVARFGRRRNLALARFGDLAQLRPCAPVDLLICADVLHYLAPSEIERGLPGLAALCGGVAFVEIYTREDAIEGDLEGFRQRSADWYRQRLRAAGLTAAGNHCYLGPALAADLAALEGWR